MKNQIQNTGLTIRANRPAPSRMKQAWRAQERREATVTFAPLAWLKLRMFLHADDVEIGGFGISDKDDLLYVEEFATVKQTVSVVNVSFDDDAVADHFDRCVDGGISPSRCGRIWVHTHPSISPRPSATDEETFGRAFGGCDWAAMVIVARGGESYARLNFTAGPGGNMIVPVTVDWERFPQDVLEHEGGLDALFSEWLDEYGRHVFPEVRHPQLPKTTDLFQDHLDNFEHGRELDDDIVSYFEHERGITRDYRSS